MSVRPHPLPPDTQHEPVRSMSLGLQFTLIVIAILMVIVFAGLPGDAERTAGNGSWRLRRDWAGRHAAEARGVSPAGVDAQGAGAPSDPAAPAPQPR